MKLITKEIKKKTPKIGANANGTRESLKFYFKLFCPWNHWT